MNRAIIVEVGDHGLSKDFIAHQILLGAGIYAIENLASLDGLPARGATLYALPMKIGGGSGAPARVLAVVPERGRPRRYNDFASIRVARASPDSMRKETRASAPGGSWFTETLFPSSVTCVLESTFRTCGWFSR